MHWRHCTDFPMFQHVKWINKCLIGSCVGHISPSTEWPSAVSAIVQLFSIKYGLGLGFRIGLRFIILILTSSPPSRRYLLPGWCRAARALPSPSVSPVWTLSAPAPSPGTRVAISAGRNNKSQPGGKKLVSTGRNCQEKKCLPVSSC